MYISSPYDGAWTDNKSPCIQFSSAINLGIESHISMLQIAVIRSMHTARCILIDYFIQEYHGDRGTCVKLIESALTKGFSISAHHHSFQPCHVTLLRGDLEISVDDATQRLALNSL